MQFSAFLFDMDGTLVDSEPLWLKNEIALMAEHGHIWTEEDQKHCIGGPLSKAGAYMESLIGGKVGSTHLEIDLVERVAKDFEKGITVFPGSLSLLREVINHQIPRGLVTASPGVLMRSCLKGIYSQFPDIKNCFSICICMEDVQRTKPDPEGYVKAAEQLNVPIDQCLVLEDSRTGIKAGLASGAWVLALPHFSLDEDQLKNPRLRVLESLEGVTVESIHSLFS
jgi:beta-phosphoglucomutase-like phosphatase (HAD superfamily)